MHICEITWSSNVRTESGFERVLLTSPRFLAGFSDIIKSNRKYVPVPVPISSAFCREELILLDHYSCGLYLGLFNGCYVELVIEAQGVYMMPL